MPAEGDEYLERSEYLDKNVNLNTAGSGKFSSDRTISEFAKDIWGLEAVTVELQGKKVR